jgi:hypothetical protein
MPRRIAERQRAIGLIDFAGPVADPSPELVLDKDRLARLKLGMLDQEILELRNQTKIPARIPGMNRKLETSQNNQKYKKKRKPALRGAIIYFYMYRITSALGQGHSFKIQANKTMSYGFQNHEHAKTTIYIHS